MREEITTRIQELFDKAYLGLKSQRFEKSLENGCPAYRSEGGEKRCAIGWLIPDELYNKKIEGYSVIRILQEGRYVPEVASIPDEEVCTEVIFFLKDLQDCHDYSLSIPEAPLRIEKNLRELARNYGLTVPGKNNDEYARA